VLRANTTRSTKKGERKRGKERKRVVEKNEQRDEGNGNKK
jgi:hypothetical protein